MTTKTFLETTNNQLLIGFTYGSKVYGTYDELSDNDYICVVTDDFDVEDKQQLNLEDGDISVYHESTFLSFIEAHEISILECLWLDSKFVIGNLSKQEEYRNYFKLNTKILRESISGKCSNSWVKAKKKMTVEKDYNFRTAIKSLYHSIRMFDFGIQIATSGKIVDYQSTKYVWDKIKSIDSTNYSVFKREFQPLYNSMHSSFVKVAPLL